MIFFSIAVYFKKESNSFQTRLYKTNAHKLHAFIVSKKGEQMSFERNFTIIFTP